MKSNNPNRHTAVKALPKLPQNLASSPAPSGSRAATVPDLEAKLQAAQLQIQDLWQAVTYLANILHMDSNGNVEISSSGKLTLVADSHIVLEAGMKVKAQTLGGASMEVTSGNVNVNASNKINISSANQINLEASSKIECESSSVEVSSPAFKHTGASFKSNGIVQCDTLKANQVLAMSVSPAAGNIW